ncbi:MAG TPA: serine/threonine-protein kinase, partial [Prosthecobacter sp.]
ITCQTCGKPLPEDAPQGICPACLLQRTLQDSTAAPQPPELEMQQLAAAFPQLVIEEMIGQGGMGRVYRAQQPHLNRTVALKVLSAERVGDPEWLERFSREARALARLSHPHIVQVYDFGEKPQPYLLMEHVDGVNLRQAMQNGGLTAREALTIVPKLCDALHYAHEHGVLHRDIKPENILIDTEGRVKLVDFGLAKLRDEGVPPFTLTQSGAKLGTMAYMAPEQVEKPAEVDHRADIYSLGVVLYEMLTGELPLGRFPTPSEASGVDPRLDDVVMRTLEKKKEKRFQDAGSMRTGIENAQTEPLAPDAMSREMFVTIVFMALWPVAIGILGARLHWGGMVVVALSSALLLACGILRLRQQAMGRPVQSYYPARIGALVASGAAFLVGSFWGPGLMALLVAALWMKITWKKSGAGRPEGGVMRCMRAVWNALGALISFVVIVTLTAMVHEWLNATLRVTWRAPGIIAVDILGLLLALQSSIPELRGAWHLMRGTTPPSHQKSSVELGICAMMAVLLAPTFSNWMPLIRFDNKPVWQAVTGAPAEPPVGDKKKAGSSTGTKAREKEAENKPLYARSNAWVARASKATSTRELDVVLKEIREALQ